MPQVLGTMGSRTLEDGTILSPWVVVGDKTWLDRK